MNILFALYICMQTATPSTGFLIVETTHQEIRSIKTTEMSLVRDISKDYHVNADSLLRDNNFFEVRTDWNKLYVERKRVVKKNGKLKYRRWRNY